jgi:hypothetical protein
MDMRSCFDEMANLKKFFSSTKSMIARHRASAPEIDKAVRVELGGSNHSPNTARCATGIRHGCATFSYLCLDVADFGCG